MSEALPSERTLQRGMSACHSDATREAPSGHDSFRSSSGSEESTASKRAALEEKRKQLLARKEGKAMSIGGASGEAMPSERTLQRGMSACRSDATREAPSGHGSF